MKLPRWTLVVVPFALMILGAAMNKTAIAVNNGQMPVESPGGCDFFEASVAPDDMHSHSCMTPQTRMKFLCDWILFKGEGWWSPGDVVFAAGEQCYWPGFFMWLALALEELGYIRGRN